MQDDDPVSGQARSTSSSALAGAAPKKVRAQSEVGQEPDATKEKILWEALPGGVRLNVWNSDRCWKAIQTQYAFCIVHRGVAEWQYRGQTFNVAAGGVYPLEPGEVHTTRKVHRTGDFSVFFLDTQWIANLASEVAGTEQPHFDARGLRLVELWRIANRAASMRVEGDADGLSQELSRCISGAVVQTSTRKPMMASGVVKRARQMICDQFYANPTQTVNIGAVAKEVGSGYHTLVHEFSRHYGAPPYEYVNLLRAQYVVGRLRSGPTQDAPSLAALSRAVGFSDPAHMSRNFRKHFFCSPSLAARQLNDGWKRSGKPRQASFS